MKKTASLLKTNKRKKTKRKVKVNAKKNPPKKEEKNLAEIKLNEK